MTSAIASAASIDPSLSVAMARAERGRKLRSVALALPLLAFLLFTYLLPLGEMLRRAVDDRDLAKLWPQTTRSISDWDRTGLPPPRVYEALAEDMRASAASGEVALAARRLNYAVNGARSVVMRTSRELRGVSTAPAEGWRQRFVALDPAWGERELWMAIARASGPVTDFYLLSALDLRRDDDDRIVRALPEEAIYLQVLLRTFWIGLVVSLICAALGYPLAVLISTSTPRMAALLMVFVLLPFWTSLLVRTAAWMVLLQENGIINQILIWTGMIEKPMRLVFNRVGVVVTMVHVLLPFMVLPILAVMRGVKADTIRAARSLGAPPITVFRKVYFPQTWPGLAAGFLLVFISAIGYYITPALMGGAEDQMLSSLIAYYTNSSANWGLASALGLLLLVSTGLIGLVYARLSSRIGNLV